MQLMTVNVTAMKQKQRAEEAKKLHRAAGSDIISLQFCHYEQPFLIKQPFHLT